MSIRVHVAALRLAGGIRWHWKRIAVGAFCGWLLSSILGAFALVGLEVLEVISATTSAFLGAAVVWGGIGVGALIAYATRARSDRDLRVEAPQVGA